MNSFLQNQNNKNNNSSSSNGSASYNKNKLKQKQQQQNRGPKNILDQTALEAVTALLLKQQSLYHLQPRGNDGNEKKSFTVNR